MADYASKLNAVYNKWDRQPDLKVIAARAPSERTSYPANRYNPTGSFPRTNRRGGRTKSKLQDNPSASWLAGFKESPSMFTDAKYVFKRPITYQCCTCMPMSRDTFVIADNGIPDMVNVLQLPAKSCRHSRILSMFANITYTYRHTVRHGYPNMTDSVIRGDLSKLAVERTVQIQLDARGQPLDENSKPYKKLKSQCEKKLKKMFLKMKAVMSIPIFKLTGWFLNVVLGNLLNSILVHESQLLTLKEASMSGKPLVYLPMHKSHLDYVLITYVLWHYGIRAPYVAAGDNLNIPMFGSILRSLGGFFIRRRLDPQEGQKDHLYRAVLKEYVSELLKSRQSLEFFIEGGRSRSGKALFPKAGLLSVVVEWVLSSRHETDGVYTADCLIVPVSISYEKLMDGNFTREQLGQPKVPESFWATIRAIWKLFSSMFGNVRVDIGQPFSLKEYLCVNSSCLKTSRSDSPAVTPSSSPPVLHTCDSMADLSLPRNQSTNSIYGIEIIREEAKNLVDSLAKHVIYSSVSNQAIMSSGLISYDLINNHRQGVSFCDLITSVTSLRDRVICLNRDVGFTGEISEVIIHALRLLYELVIITNLQTNETLNWRDLYDFNDSERRQILIQPNISLPTILELHYYSNSVSPVFIRHAIIVSSISAVCQRPISDCSSNINESMFTRTSVIERALFLNLFLKYEYLIAPTCADVEQILNDTFEQLITDEILFYPYDEDDYNEEAEQFSSRIARRTMYALGEEAFDPYLIPDKQYQINYSCPATIRLLQMYSNTIQPTIECYWFIVYSLQSLLERDTPVDDFTKICHAALQERVKTQSTNFPETVALDMVKNCIKILQDINIVETYTIASEKMLTLCKPYTDRNTLNKLISSVDNFKPL